MPATGLTAECSAELQGVRGKMMRMRAEVDAAKDRADDLTKSLTETTEKLHQVEEERNTLQRQSVNINDQLFVVESQLKDANDKMMESESNREVLLNEVKSLTHRLNMMDAAEEAYKSQLTIEKDNATQFEAAAAEFKRNVDRLQMDNDKLEHDSDLLKADNIHLAQQLKEAEDRIAELTTSYNQVVMENKLLEHHRTTSGRHHHEIRSIHEAPQVQLEPADSVSRQEIVSKDRQLQATVKDLDDALSQLNKKEAKISQLENEVYVYQENYRLITNQLREVEQVNMELKQQLRGRNVNRSDLAGDKLIDALEQNRTLNTQLSESEKLNAAWEAKGAELARRISQLEMQLQEQKAAYGELYSQMNRTIKDLEKGTGGVHDF